MLSVSSIHNTTITIDDEPVVLHIKRMKREEAIPFEREFWRFGKPRGDWEKLSQAEKDEHNASFWTFVEESIVAFVSVAPGQVEEDGSPVLTGQDVLRVFGAREDVIRACYESIYGQNFLGLAAKNIWSSRPVFSPGSPQPPKIATGSEPGSAASSVDATSTAKTDAATDPEVPNPSGESVH